MKLAIVGSRGISDACIEDYITENVSEIVSGGARGVDSLARDFAIGHGIVLTEFLPDYSRCGRGAPLLRNRTIVEYSDEVLVFWDGKSKGTKYVIDYCKKLCKPVRVIFR